MTTFAYNMEFIDTHTHSYDTAYDGCADEAIERALNVGVSHLIQADIDSSERPRMLELCGRHPDVLHPMLGLYPGSVGENWRDEVSAIEEQLKAGLKAAAIGEIGLDYHYGRETAALQKEAFVAQLELAHEWNLPVNLHLREATEDFFAIMESCRHLSLRGNIHAFSGNHETFERMKRYGSDWYVGIGGVVTFKKASIASELAKIPAERILLETDAPYLTPTPHRGERNESSYIPLIAAKVAEIKGKDISGIAGITSTNAKILFNI